MRIKKLLICLACVVFGIVFFLMGSGSETVKEKTVANTQKQVVVLKDKRGVILGEQPVNVLKNEQAELGTKEVNTAVESENKQIIGYIAGPYQNIYKTKNKVISLTSLE